MTTILDLPIDLAILAACKAVGACREGIEAARKASCWRDIDTRYLGRAAAFAPGLSESDREVLADASGSADFWRGMAAAYAPGVSPDWRERMIAASNRPDYWRGVAGARAPDVPPEWREQMIALSDDFDYWRSLLRR